MAASVSLRIRIARSILFDQLQQALYGISLRDILLDADLAAIEAYLLGPCTNVAVICIGHFAGSVDNTAHYSDF